MRQLAEAGVDDAEFVDHPEHVLALQRERALAMRHEQVMRHEHALAMRERFLDEAPTTTRESSPWVPLAIGLSVVAVVGVLGVVMYLLVRRKDNETTVLGAVDPRYLPAPAPQAPQVFVINAGGVQTPAPVAAAEPAALAESPLPPFYPSATPFHQRLSSIDSNAPAERLVTAGAHPLEVVVHVAEPRGATAVLAFTPNALHTPHAIVLPSGQERRIRVDRHQTLYAKGRSSAGPVIVSVVAG